jgi:hypothetical protein
MNALDAMLGGVNWAQVRSALGGSAYVPAALARLIEADSEDEAREAYWELDNGIILQRRIFDAARQIVAPLMISLHRPLSPAARYRILDLLIEISMGVSDLSEDDLGNSGLADQCRQEIRNGLWCIYGGLDDSDPRIRVNSMDLLAELEPDSHRLRSVLASKAAVETDPTVLGRVHEILAGR